VDVALATSSEVPDLHPEDGLLIAALARRGLSTRPFVWDRDPVPATAAILLRSVWDYHLRLPEFLLWVEREAARRPFWNPPALVAWNARKTYLRDLEARGVPIIPTLWAARGAAFDLAAELRRRGWRDVVIKPVVSASAHGTARHREGASPEARAHLAALTAAGDAMIQPFQPAVDSYGERSLLVLGGAVTHAVKRPAVLAPEYDGVEVAPRVEPSEAEIALARRVLSALAELHPAAGEPLPLPLYARVDMTPDAEGRPRLMELELIEPRLFFEEAPEAAERLADALAARLG